MAKYVDQQRSLGFKFRVQQILLRGYVGFAEERGDRHIRSARVLAWPHERRHRSSAAIGCLPCGGSRWRCTPRIRAIRFRRRMHSATLSSSGDRRISIVRTRSHDCFALRRHFGR